MTEQTDAAEECRVYWGSHGCDKPRGHDGLHECDCCDCPDHVGNQGRRSDEGGDWVCVATWPYYGPETRFLGEDAPAAAARGAEGGATA